MNLATPHGADFFVFFSLQYRSPSYNTTQRLQLQYLHASKNPLTGTEGTTRSLTGSHIFYMWSKDHKAQARLDRHRKRTGEKGANSLCFFLKEKTNKQDSNVSLHRLNMIIELLPQETCCPSATKILLGSTPRRPMQGLPRWNQTSPLKSFNNWKAKVAFVDSRV